MKKGLLIVFSGPSGVGKGTIRKRIMRDRSLNLAYSVSMTTRNIRPREINGVDYFFITNEEFDARLAQGGFLEWCEFVGNKYGTPIDKIEQLRNSGKNVFLEIEVVGATQVMEKMKDDPGLMTIFLIPPSLEELEARIRHRKTETEDKIAARLNKAKSEMNQKNLYQYVVVNDYVKKASIQVSHILAERIKEKR